MKITWKENGGNGTKLVLTDGKNYASSPLAHDLQEILKKDTAFTGKVGNVRTYSQLVDGQVEKLIIAGVADLDQDSYKLRKVLATATAEAAKEKVETLWVPLDQAPEGFSLDHLAMKTAEMTQLAGYLFEDYKEKPKDQSIETVLITGSSLEDAVHRGTILGAATLHARNLVNHPANIMTPAKLAENAVETGAASGFEVTIHDQNAIEDLKMPAYMEVAKASINKPHLIVMDYKGNPGQPEDILGLVGKGLTFDTGGYSLKPRNSMLDMKSDMGGSAAVIGAMKAIAEAGLKVNVTAVVAACENMLDGTAYRPGDIIQSRGGKSIYIKSTDAEGRLTLVDAVDYVIKDKKASRVVDIATLTGACLHALGNTTTGAVTNDQAFYDQVAKAADLAEERIWLMPSHPEFKALIKHHEADLINATATAGMITAGLFIGEFVGDTPWVHMDIAGTAWNTKKSAESIGGATGAGVRTLFRLAEGLQG